MAAALDIQQWWRSWKMLKFAKLQSINMQRHLRARQMQVGVCGGVCLLVSVCLCVCVWGGGSGMFAHASVCLVTFPHCDGVICGGL